MLDFHLNWQNRFRFPILVGGPLFILIGCMIFSSTTPTCYKDVYVKGFFSGTAKLPNSLPTECFPLTYDLNGFLKPRANSSLLSPGSFKTAFLYAFYLFLLLFHVNTIPSSGCSWNESEVMKVKENQTETDHPWCFAKEKLQ